MSDIFGGGSTRTRAAAPTVSAPTPMPDTEDPAVLAARRRAMADAAARGGRASTILSGGSTSPLGASPAPSAAGDSYSASTLGGR